MSMCSNLMSNVSTIPVIPTVMDKILTPSLWTTLMDYSKMDYPKMDYPPKMIRVSSVRVLTKNFEGSIGVVLSKSSYD